MKRPQHAKRCPFCGSADLMITEWWDDDGEYNAVACRNCKAEAPESTWNTRASWPSSHTSELSQPLPAILRPQAE